eukprot:TRINITY_DN13588_c0_g2_i1.p1 TRINITY_DN13588_c0_g2~~TRINITY_DN13588_c0_g2_i1.p1  ORF type:complete len:511 (+),score=72.53 TRINITY_DN13588_c0_g2_i1:71-1603(+)
MFFVFRPQSNAGHVAGCGGQSHCGSSRCHGAATRQTLKAKRRTQAPAKEHKDKRRAARHPRQLPAQLQARRRCQLAEFPDILASSTPTDSHSDTALSADDLLEGNSSSRRHREEGCGVVRARLRSRLVDRRADDLAEALEKKHGHDWAAKVQEGTFDVIQYMRLMCEAFCLRPQLERQVFQAVVGRSRARSASSLADEAVPARPAFSLPGAGKAASAADSDAADWDACSASTLEPESEVSACDSSCQFELHFEESPDDEAASTTAQCHERESDRTPSESLCTQDTQEVDDASYISVMHRCRGDASCAERIASLPLIDSYVPLCPSCGQSLRWEDAHVHEDESRGLDLNDRLVLAKRNAALHASLSATQRIDRQLTPQSEDDCSSPYAGFLYAQPDTSASSSSRGAPSRPHRSAKFVTDSEVMFFRTNFDDEIKDEYTRPVSTKAFDGPSGHKTTRRVPPKGGEVLANVGDEGEMDLEEWEDECDDVAELMCQKRGCVLWSGTPCEPSYKF